MTTPIDMLCKDFPKQFQTYFEYCRSLRFEDKPDYSYLKRLFKDLFANKGMEMDHEGVTWASMSITSSVLVTRWVIVRKSVGEVVRVDVVRDCVLIQFREQLSHRVFVIDDLAINISANVCGECRKPVPVHLYVSGWSRCRAALRIRPRLRAGGRRRWSRSE